MFNKITDTEVPSEKFNGFYRAEVVDTSDELQAGRVRVRVYPMFEGVKDAALPWAIPSDPLMGGSANVGSINVPLVGAHVFVFFENGDHRYPVYFAGAPAIQNNVPDIPTLSRESDDTVTTINNNKQTGVSTASGGAWDEPGSAYNAEYPNNHVVRSEKGITVEIDDTDGQVRFHVFHPSGTRSEVDNDGNQVDHIEGTHYEVVISDENTYVKGAKNLTVDGDTNIKVGSNAKIVVEGNTEIDTTGTTTVNSTGNTDVTTPQCTVNGDVITNGNVKLDGGGGQIVTTQHICAFTGNPHPAGSSTCEAKP